MNNIDGGNPENKKKGKVGAIVYGIAAIAILLLPFFTFQDPPPGQPGVQVNLGIPDVGQGNENAPKTEAAAKPEKKVEKKKVEPKEPVEKPKKPKKTKVKKKEPVKKKIVTNDNSKERAIETAKKKAAAVAAKKVRDAEEAAKAEERRIEAAKEAVMKAAAAKAAKLAAEAEKTKSGIGNLFNGNGKGKTGKPGNQGNPDGDPNADKLVGAVGQIGGGLTGRGGKAPPLEDNSQEIGIVVIKVTVNSNGKVISAKFTQSGSNTSSKNLINKALKHAKRFKFNKGDIDEQSGTITYNFQVK